MEVNYFTIFYWFCHISTWIHHGFISPVSIFCTLNDSFFQLKTKNPILLARYLSQLSSYLQEVVNPKFTFDIDRPYTFQSILLALLLVREIDSWFCETKSSPLNLYNMSPSDIGLWSMVPHVTPVFFQSAAGESLLTPFFHHAVSKLFLLYTSFFLYIRLF